MQPTDYELLADFARSESEEAFAGLVERHVNLVYSTALRFTGNPHHAEEITQAVFIILARKSGKISPRVVLSGWLYQTTRLTAANFVKSETRRQRREQEAYMQSTLIEPEPPTWRQIAPMLDDAMSGLSEADRNALVLRFFENKTAAQVAAALNVSEAAAHKRTARSLQKLRKLFSQRGVNSTTSVIAGVVSAHAVQNAPAGLAKSVSILAAAKGVAATGSTLTLVKGALKIMAWTKTKTAIVIGAAAMLAAGTTTIVMVKHHPSGSKNPPNRIGTNPGDFAPAKVSAMAQMKSIQMTVVPAFIEYAKEHDDDIPAYMRDLQPYLPPDTNGINYDNWEILATGKLTPQLKQKDVVLLQQKEVPNGQYAHLKVIGYTDGHFTAKK